MSPTPRRSSTTRPSPARAKPAPAEAAPTPGREPRGARRKRETRARLLDAALRLMADKGMEGVAINEITEAADVGFGSFYNHFESKEAIYAALVDQVFEEFADALDRLVAPVSDPAEVIAVSVRHTMLRAQREPLWARFLVRESLSIRGLERGLSQRLLRDVQKGLATGRFKSADPMMTFLTVGGTVLAAIAADLQLRADTVPTVVAVAIDAALLPERTAAALLRSLGVAPAEADRISRAALPQVSPPAEPTAPAVPPATVPAAPRKTRR